MSLKWSKKAQQSLSAAAIATARKELNLRGLREINICERGMERHERKLR